MSTTLFISDLLAPLAAWTPIPAITDDTNRVRSAALTSPIQSPSV
jgi:hypothetical protein